MINEVPSSAEVTAVALFDVAAIGKCLTLYVPCSPPPPPSPDRTALHAPSSRRVVEGENGHPPQAEHRHQTASTIEHSPPPSRQGKGHEEAVNIDQDRQALEPATTVRVGVDHPPALQQQGSETPDRGSATPVLRTGWARTATWMAATAATVL